MRADELTPAEQAVLVGVIRHLVELDGEVSDSELYDLIRIGTEIGHQDFRTAIQASEAWFQDRSQTLASLDTITRESVRQRVLSELQRVAEGDGMHATEQSFLSAARERWG